MPKFLVPKPVVSNHASPDELFLLDCIARNPTNPLGGKPPTRVSDATCWTAHILLPKDKPRFPDLSGAINRLIALKLVWVAGKKGEAISLTDSGFAMWQEERKKVLGGTNDGTVAVKTFTPGADKVQLNASKAFGSALDGIEAAVARWKAAPDSMSKTMQAAVIDGYARALCRAANEYDAIEESRKL